MTKILCNGDRLSVGLTLAGGLGYLHSYQSQQSFLAEDLNRCGLHQSTQRRREECRGVSDG